MKNFLTLLLCFLLGSVLAQKIAGPLVYTVNPSNGSLQRPPLLIMLHGYGSNEMDLFDISKVLDPRLITIAVRAPNTMGNGAYNWFEFGNSNGKRVYDYKAAAKSRDLLLAFISNACKTIGADSTQVYVMGFSQGAILSYELAMSAPDKIKGILALSGRLMDETRTIKTDQNKLKGVSMFIAHGKSDQVIPFEEYTKVHQFFLEKQVRNLTAHAYEMPHSISGAELNDIKTWLRISLDKSAEIKK